MNAQRNKSLLFALALDLALGEPPNRLHPVAWMGNMIDSISRYAPHKPPLPDLLFGGWLVIGGATFWAGLGKLSDILFHRLPQPFNWLAEGLLLKTTFSLRGLVDAARAIEHRLHAGNLAEARRLLGWHLVSRPTAQLDESGVSTAVIESVAENTCDSLVAPLFYYTQGGLQAAMAYRFINTSDAMLGYHDEDHEWLGKIPARLDDLVNLLPARLSGFLIVVAAFFSRNSWRQAWQTMRRQAKNTLSPNAGYPMSAMAGALNVELEKSGHYRLGVGNPKAQPGDIQRAIQVLLVLSGLLTGLLCMLKLISNPCER